MRALSRWPKDTLRPESQFQDAMRRRIDRKFLPDASMPNAVPVNEKAEMEEVNALYSLLENRYDRKVNDRGPGGNGTQRTGLIACDSINSRAP